MNASFIFCFCIEAIWCNSWVQVTPFDLHHHRHNLVARLPGAILAAPFVLWTKLKKYNLCRSFVSKFFKNPFASCKNDFVEMQNWHLTKTTETWMAPPPFFDICYEEAKNCFAEVWRWCTTGKDRKKGGVQIQLTIFGKILVLWSKWNVLVIVIWVLDWNSQF